MLAALSACTSFGGGRPAAPVAVSGSEAAALVNGFRGQYGLAPVKTDRRLDTAARKSAMTMASRGKLSHNSAGRLPRRVASAGYSWSVAVENIAKGYRTLPETIAGWEASAGHRKNLLNAQVEDVGIGAASSGGTVYWTLVMAAPRREPLLMGPPQ